MASFVEKTAGTSPTMRLLPAPAVMVYRRSSTCKAPRKRVALLTLQKRDQKSVCTAGAITAGPGGNGPNGPANNTRFWGSGDDHFNYHRYNVPLTMSPAAFAVTLAGMGLWGVQAGPAAAAMVAGVADNALGTEGYAELFDSNMAVLEPHSTFAGDDNECICGDGLTAEERELLDPKQYRVREWVFVH